MQFVKRLCLAALLIPLVGCALTTRSAPPDTARADLAARLAAAKQAQAAALALWDRVIFGEAVSCQEAIAVPELITVPERALTAHPGADAIQARLNAAIKTLRDSSDLWNIECSDERTAVPLDMARAGRASALAASGPLTEAETLLAALP